MAKMVISVIVNGDIDSDALYKELKDYGMNVTNAGDKTYVNGIVDAREPIVIPILEKCNKYGTCDTSVTLTVD